MPDWISIAAAHNFDIPAADLDRAIKPLNALEESFRPLVKDLAPDLEPATAFRAEEDGE
jgi:hypothetical protein